METTAAHGHQENQDINNEVRPNDIGQESSQLFGGCSPGRKSSSDFKITTDANSVEDQPNKSDQLGMSKGQKNQDIASNASSRVSTSTPSSSSSSSNRGKMKCKSAQQKVDAKARLEKSRQSARECRARKKLRYQYLEDLATKRELAVFALRKELQLNLETLTKLVTQADLSPAEGTKK